MQKTMMTAALAAMAFACPAYAQFNSTPPAGSATIVFKAPDGKVYQTSLLTASSLKGYKLTKTGAEEKGVGKAIGRIAETVRTNIPKKLGGKECSMEYLSFHVKTTGGKQIASFTGTHAACKDKTEIQGTVIECPDRPGVKTVQWVGDTAPTTCPVMAK